MIIDGDSPGSPEKRAQESIVQMSPSVLLLSVFVQIFDFAMPA
jgi:hypothetical protein